jgi:glucokinase
VILGGGHAKVEEAGGDLIVGVDVGGTNSSVGIVDGEGKILAQARFPTQAGDPAETYVGRLVGVMRELHGRLQGAPPLQAVAIAAPAANSREGVVESPANFSWGRINLVAMVKRAMDLPVSIINDGNAAALGEARYGVASGMTNILIITLGTGLGAGIVLDGRLVQGHTSAAGEFGHMALVPGGRQCACGERGCAETYISAPGLRRTVFELLAERVDESPLRRISFDELTAEMVARFARDGDAVANAAFEKTGDYLGRLLASLVAAFDPEAIVLCGGLVNAGDLLVSPARRSLSEHVLERCRGVKLLVSGLKEGQAAILGASWLARETLQGAVSA